MDRLRQAIAERVPPASEADLAQIDALEWQWLEDGWARVIEREHQRIAEYEELIREHRGWISAVAATQVTAFEGRDPQDVRQVRSGHGGEAG
jgi:hypothetical protein